MAMRAGVTRQAAGQLLREIERCGYVTPHASSDDARATVVQLTARGRRLLVTVLKLVDEIEDDFAGTLEHGEFERVREALFRIAESIDSGGALGGADRAGSPPPVRQRAGSR
jgi:DNA-binding MarR family transcriptional regulator